MKPLEPEPPDIIVIYPDRENALLHIKPRGVLEPGPRNEIVRLLREWQTIGVRDIVIQAAGICERHGWSVIEWSYAGQVTEGPAVGQRDIAVKLAKAAPQGKTP